MRLRGGHRCGHDAVQDAGVAADLQAEIRHLGRRALAGEQRQDEPRFALQDEVGRGRRAGPEPGRAAGYLDGADRATLVTLATVLAATGADHDGVSYFGALAASQPDQVLPLALAGYFQVRAGEDVPAGLAKLDDAASRDLGPAQYYRGLALAALPAGAGQAGRAVADLEFVLAVRDQFPGNMIRAVYHGLAAAHAALGHDDLAAKAAADSGLSAAPAAARLQFAGGWARPSSPRDHRAGRASRRRRAGAAASAGPLPADGAVPAAGSVPLPHLRRPGGSRNRPGRPRLTSAPAGTPRGAEPGADAAVAVTSHMGTVSRDDPDPRSRPA